MTARLKDWDDRLGSYLAAATEAVREGREHFCALFAAGAVEAQTGENPAEAFRGRYAETAENLERTIDGLFAERPKALARRGDLAWHDGAVGVVIGSDALFVGENAAGEPDLVRVPRRDWVKAWGVGDV